MEWKSERAVAGISRNGPFCLSGHVLLQKLDIFLNICYDIFVTNLITL